MNETGNGPSPEQVSSDEEKTLTPIELSEDIRGDVEWEVESIENTLADIEGGDEYVSLSDATESIESLNQLLADNPTYQALKSMSAEASKKAMEAYGVKDKAMIKEAVQARREWIDKLKSLIS